ncbi:hypothetical protein BQ9231_00478 [Cedratvirus lausannensis]|uniref:Uncharacterized protein n=1 Tax=Cedratvirus lausannensis TaxID=2023205 RepID=A0A285PXK1_9VIRU|nr:hypothetical protein BQ9231_00478 [Cedratvirus lausannensis]
MQSEDMSKDDHGMFVSDKHGMSKDDHGMFVSDKHGMSKDDHGMFVSDKHGMSGDKPIFIFDLDDTLVFYNKKGAKVPREVSRYFSACFAILT